MSRIDEIMKAGNKKKKVNENTMNSRARTKLNEQPGVVCHKYHGSSYTVAGHSDLYGSIHGYAFYIEGKTGSNKPNKNQVSFLKKHADANCITGIYYTADEAVDIVVQGFLNKMEQLPSGGTDWPVAGG